MIIRPDEDVLKTFQSNISTIRILLGWSAEKLSEILDLSRTALNNYQSGRISLSVISYYALWTVFNYASEHCEDDRRAYFVNALIDGENYNHEKAEAIKDSVARSYRRCGRRNGTEQASEYVLEALSERFPESLWYYQKDGDA